jgi:predicted O-linked N-acetylglucosamine transferase (SPINDLY family)
VINLEANAARALVAQRPNDPAAHLALAQALDRAGDPERAMASLRAALALAPGLAEAHNLQGILLGGAGETGAAVASFREAIASKPDYARAWNNLGNSLKVAGRLAEAEDALAEAVRLQPDYQLAHHNLGAVRYDQGKSDEAVVALSASLQLNMKFRPSWIMGALAERQRGRLDESIAAFGQAIALDPAHSADERVALAEVLSECGLHDDALRTYAEARNTLPQPLPAALGFHLTLPQIYPDAGAIDQQRARFETGLAEIERDFERYHAHLGGDATLEAWRWSNFLLAYQGRDDRDLQQRYAGLVARAIASKTPHWRAPVPASNAAGRRIRVGFASAFLVDGTVGQYFRRWITALERSEFEVFVYHVTAKHDAVTADVMGRADRFHIARGAGGSIAALAAVIRGDALDVLVYPELGMDTRCMVLAALRLAPVQCAGWGHPVTSGHDTIDHYFTAGAMEPDDADAHYVEKLVRLPGIGTSYPRPVMPDQPVAPVRTLLLERLGLPAGTPLFLCPQALFKILPDDDALFARVLEAVPGSVLLVFGRHRALTGQFLRRLGLALTALGLNARERVRVLARMPRQDFLQVNAACDAMLDTQHWSGGNTSLDAIAAGLPIVALPGRFMRGRQSAAMLRMMGMDELIANDADDYVRISARLAQDRSWRQTLARRIGENSARLFDDPAPLASLAVFLQRAAGR